MSNSSEPLSTYPLDQLLARWRRGDLTADQMVGHLLQYIIAHEHRLHRVEHPPTASQRPPVGTIRR